MVKVWAAVPTLEMVSFWPCVTVSEVGANTRAPPAPCWIVPAAGGGGVEVEPPPYLPYGLPPDPVPVVGEAVGDVGDPPAGGPEALLAQAVPRMARAAITPMGLRSNRVNLFIAVASKESEPPRVVRTTAFSRLNSLSVKRGGR